jgi:hypothetical protein
MQGAFGLVSPNVRINFHDFAVVTSPKKSKLPGTTTFERTRRASTIFANFLFQYHSNGNQQQFTQNFRRQRIRRCGLTVTANGANGRQPLT